LAVMSSLLATGPEPIKKENFSKVHTQPSLKGVEVLDYSAIKE